MPARRYVRREVEHVLRDRLELTPIVETETGDVFIVGYPKSGTTWFQKLVAGVVYGIDPQVAPDALIQDVVFEVDFKRWYRRYGQTSYFRSHHLPRPEYRRVVYLLRDGRDAMVSNLHFRTNLEQKEYDLLKMVRDGEGLYPSKWHEHVEAWLSNPFGADMLIVRYEDMKKDCVRELRRFCEFVSEPRDDAFLQSVAAAASFENMRENERRHGWVHRPTWPSDRYFVRRGQVGAYRDEMPPAILRVFENEARLTLIKCGYMEPTGNDVIDTKSSMWPTAGP